MSEFDYEIRPVTDQHTPLPPTAHGFTARKVRDTTYSWERFFREKPFALVIVGFLLVSLFSSQWLGERSYLFRTSLIDSQPIEFTGTTMPVQQMADWSQLTPAERQMRFDQLPAGKIIPIPDYTPNFTDVRGTTITDKDRINAYITYSVPYMGNYELDGTAHSGSHLAVDIKAPTGTPVHAIANGVVTKAEASKYGSGLHVVVTHVGVPALDNANTRTTYRSSYSHLSAEFVQVGQTVTKGEVIGQVGSTGMSTTPHLHFQIDTNQAPFSPYWPFTWKEIEAAGINSFFDGVRMGYGKQKAYQYTIDPMAWVMQYQDFIPTADLTVEAGLSTETTLGQMLKANTTPEPPANEGYVPSAASQPVAEPQWITPEAYTAGEVTQVTLTIDPATDLSAGVRLRTSLGDQAFLSPTYLTAHQLQNGQATVDLLTQSTAGMKVIAEGAWGQTASAVIDGQEKPTTVTPPLPQPKLIPDSAPEPPAEPQLQPAPAPEPHSTLKDITDHQYAEAIKALHQRGVINGYQDQTYRPDNEVNRAETVKLLIEGLGIDLAYTVDLPFHDTEPNTWYVPYLETALTHQYVTGYDDNTFRPARSVTRAEFVTLAARTTGAQIPQPYHRVAKDVRSSDWFAPYIAYALEHEALPANRVYRVQPHESITRGEAAFILYKLLNI